MNVQPYFQEIQPAPLTVTLCQVNDVWCMFACQCLYVLKTSQMNLTVCCFKLFSKLPGNLQTKDAMKCFMCHKQSLLRQQVFHLVFNLLLGHSPVYEQAPDTAEHSCTPLSNGTETDWISPPAQVEQSAYLFLPAIKISKGKQPSVADRG